MRKSLHGISQPRRHCGFTIGILMRDHIVRVPACIKSSLRALRRMVVRTMSGLCAAAVALSEGRILIIAPHPDDEVFGCGGLMAGRIERGVGVDVVFLTGGEGSHRDCCDTPAGAIAAARRRLAVEAGGGLGIDPANQHWLGLTDGAVPHVGEAGFEAAAERLAAVIGEVAPAEVYCTHPLDVWSDHVAAAELTHAAVSRLAVPCRVRYYLVWAWLNQGIGGLMRLGWRGCRRLDIRPVMEKKRQAIGVYVDETSPKCGNPWSGVLPRDFLKAFEWPFELFFEADEPRGSAGDSQ